MSVGARCTRLFLSTPSARRATLCHVIFQLLLCISIHALREEGDPVLRHHRPEEPISIHALREEGDDSPRTDQNGKLLFLSTPSARRATVLLHTVQAEPHISIHALREEGDSSSFTLPSSFRIFLSTPSARRATCLSVISTPSWSFLSTPSARRATFVLQHMMRLLINFYPRPPRGGRRDGAQRQIRVRRFLSTPSARRATAQQSTGCTGLSNFYPRPPRGGRRDGAQRQIRVRRFLSTPSARRATQPLCGVGARSFDFYPRPPRGGRPDDVGGGVFLCPISIHALREEGDIWRKRYTMSTILFLSTPSARRATSVRVSISRCRESFLSTPSARRATYGWAIGARDYIFLSTPSARRATILTLLQRFRPFISIHALREEGDCPPLPASRRPPHFYPRPPRGGRRASRVSASGISSFLSTPSARRATADTGGEQPHTYISIHALREEGDRRCSARSRFITYFYPRPPRGGRRVACCVCMVARLFLSTPSARRATSTRRCH